MIHHRISSWYDFLLVFSKSFALFIENKTYSKRLRANYNHIHLPASEFVVNANICKLKNCLINLVIQFCINELQIELT